MACSNLFQAKPTIEQLQEIERRHTEAINTGKMFYSDPLSGNTVMTSTAHSARKKCCGNQCRHCPYGHVNVGIHHRCSKESCPFSTLDLVSEPSSSSSIDLSKISW